MKDLLEAVFNMIPGTYFLGIFEEGLIVASSSRVDKIDKEIAASVSQKIIQAIKKGIKIRSERAYGDFKEALLRTEQAIIYLLFIKENNYGLVGIFNREIPVGRIKAVLKNQTELLNVL